MNNKRLGTEFEQKMCGLLADEGWWVYFIEPKQSERKKEDEHAGKKG